MNEYDNSESIPNDRNLFNSKIDFYLLRLNNFINDSIDKSVTKFRDTNSFEKFSNPINKKLHSERSKIVTIIKKHNRLECLLSNVELILFKTKLKLIRNLINENFSILYHNYYVVEGDNLKLKAIGTFFESVHSHKETDADNNLHVEINNSFSSFLKNKSEFENSR